MDAIPTQYWQNGFFLFLPNVCNARCPFCYIRPTYADSARLAPASLQRADRFFNRISEAGFKQVKFTGGDPTVFENLPALVGLARSAGLSYTVLTNGFAGDVLGRCMDVLLPSKVTVSFHSFLHYAEMFGVDRKRKDAIQSVVGLLAREVEVCVSCVVFGDNSEELVSIIDYFHELGVREFKLIQPNVPSDPAGTLVFDRAVARLRPGPLRSWQGARIRASDPRVRTCMLRQRGFLSCAMPGFDLYDCCINVGDRTPLVLADDFSNLEESLAVLYRRGRVQGGIPCISHTGACPIALRELSSDVHAGPQASLVSLLP